MYHQIISGKDLISTKKRLKVFTIFHHLIYMHYKNILCFRIISYLPDKQKDQKLLHVSLVSETVHSCRFILVELKHSHNSVYHRDMLNYKKKNEVESNSEDLCHFLCLSNTLGNSFIVNDAARTDKLFQNAPQMWV